MTDGPTPAEAPGRTTPKTGSTEKTSIRDRFKTQRLKLARKMSRDWLTLLTVVFSTVAIAFVGLFLEDVVPIRSACADQAVRCYAALPPATWLRLAFALVSLVVVYNVWRMQQDRDRSAGTLYYLRLLQAGSADWHLDDIHREDCLDFRSTTRWFDPEAPWQDPRYIDVVQDVHEMSVELERMTNDDTDETSYQVAPNMAAAAALAIGYDWLPHAGGDRAEAGKRKSRAGRRSARARKRSTRPQKSADSVRSVELREFNNSPVKSQPDPAFRFFLRDCLSKSRVAPDCGDTGIESCDFPVRRSSPPKRVWLAIKLSAGPTITGKASAVDDGCPLRESCDQVRLIASLDGDDLRQVQVPGEGPPTSQGGPKPSSNGTGKTEPVTTPVEVPAVLLTQITEYWIRKTLEDYPGAHVFLSLQVPKTVALATGWLLSTLPSGVRSPDPLSNPWSRLVTVHYIPGTGNRIMRVRRDQVRPADLFDRGGLLPYLRKVRGASGPGSSDRKGRRCPRIRSL